MSQTTLPPDWKRARIEDVILKFQYGLSIRGEATGAYPILRMNNLVGGKVDAANLQFIDAPSEAILGFKLRKGDLLFNRTNSYELVGKTSLFDLDGDFVFASYLIRLIPDRGKVVPDYLNFYLNGKSAQQQMKSMASRGVSQSNISASKLSKLWIDLPCLPEQDAIARALRTVQEARDARRKELRLERERKAALMQHLFARGAGTRNKAERKTRFGQVPAHWKEMLLSECAIVQTGAAKGRKFGESKTVSVPYLRVANVQDGYLDLSEIKNTFIRESEIERYKLKFGDVVLTEGGDFDKLGRGFIWKESIPNCIHQNHVFAVRVNRELLLPDFFSYLTQSQYGKAYFLSVAHRTTNLACINSAKLKAFPVLVPSLEEQKAIVKVLELCDAKLSAIEQEESLLDELFRAMLEELMTGKLSAVSLIE